MNRSSRTSGRVLCVMLLLGIQVAFGAMEPLGAPGTDLTQTLLEESGIKKLTEQIPTLVTMGMEQAGKASLRPADLEELRGFAATAFSAKKMFEEIVAKCSQKLPPDKVAKLLEWHRQPLARKMVAIETERSAPANIEAMQKFMTELAEKPLPPKREELFRRMDKALKSSENNVQLVTKVQFGMMKALNQMAPKEQRQTEEQFAAAEKQARENMGKMIEGQVIGSWGYIYQGIPDEDLETYVAFYETEDGRLWSQTVCEVLIQVLEEASIALGKTIGQNFQKPLETLPASPAASPASGAVTP